MKLVNYLDLYRSGGGRLPVSSVHRPSSVDTGHASLGATRTKTLSGHIFFLVVVFFLLPLGSYPRAFLFFYQDKLISWSQICRLEAASHWPGLAGRLEWTSFQLTAS